MIRPDNKLARLALCAALIFGFASPSFAAKGSGEQQRSKIDRVLERRAGSGGTSKVIITFRPGHGDNASKEVIRLGGRLGRRLAGISGQAIELPNAVLRKLAERSEILSIHHDRPTGGEVNRAAVTIGARMVQREYSYTGTGVGVAVIDSGITAHHADLQPSGNPTYQRSLNNQRVMAFVDFVNGRTKAYDDNGHGTHVAGIIAGNGADSHGARAGVAPLAHLLALKVLDHRGAGVISDVIAAMDWVVANKAAHNIRVVNLSVGAAVTESYHTDPLALAAKRVVDSGIVVVTAAGNLGKNANGEHQYGGITAPGNAPWVLTVGAFSHEGTVARADDVMGGYSSRGPTAIDYHAKPDVVAPGTGIVSLSDPNSTFYETKAGYLLTGSVARPYKPYLSLTGTSMAAPFVSGTVALMVQANPSLTPNMVKAILQFTAQEYAGYNPLTQGAGFLNTFGAVQLSRFFGHASHGHRLAMPSAWSKKIQWGNMQIKGGVIRPNANAFEQGTTWGALYDGDGDHIVWGTYREGDNIVWGTFDTLSSEDIVWGMVHDSDGENIVWGTHAEGDNIVWGTMQDVDNVVWGADCGGGDCENIVWGTNAEGSGDNIVWGTMDRDENIVWGTDGGNDNIVWGTNGDSDNIVWGTSSESDNITWGNSGEDPPLFDDPNGAPANYDASVWEDIFPVEPIEAARTPVAEETTAWQLPVLAALGGRAA